MPPKQPIQTRAWGTRYDTLPSSPPVSPDTTRDEMQAIAQLQEASGDEQTTRKDDRLPRDASIFVGSLPTNVDQAELTQLLTVHLAGHAEIKSIKVIRDSKGGVCAFVQCEDVASASAFLHCLQSSPPRPFLGRILRYEQARAFRTLLISYRAPIRVVGPGNSIGTVSPVKVPEVKLPHAMRLWKPKNMRYHRILYDVEAVEAERFARSQSEDQATTGKDDAVYFQPVRFDAESIVKLASYFGPLESVVKLTESHGLVKLTQTGTLNPDCYPPPHNAPRSNIMDSSCWEVKWVHRDDCVTALMALRRIPHLSATWAHQLQSPQSEYRFTGHASHLTKIETRMDRFQPYISSSFVTSSSPASESLNIGSVASSIASYSKLTGDDMDSKNGNVSNNSEDKTWPNPTIPLGFNCQPTSLDNLTPEKAEKLEHQVNAKVDWAETDFSPLHESDFDKKLDWNTWGETVHLHDQRARPHSIITSQSISHVHVRTHKSPVLSQGDDLPTPGLDMSPTTPRSNLSHTPHTPTTHTRELHPPSIYKTKGTDQDNGDSSSCMSREIDPTTLFVGGLEMYGPGAWNEGKLQEFFGRFGGLEHVRLVRPSNGNTAFAFVKYNNTESPAQAIVAEHNRVYAGRALKVQLRDINPPRSIWRSYRGRGRFGHYHAPRKLMLARSPESGLPKDDDATNKQQQLQLPNATIRNSDLSGLCESSAGSGSEASIDEGPEEKDKGHCETIRSTEGSQAEKYREWYDTPIAASPSDTAIASPTSTSSLGANPNSVPPYHVPGYYPIPWIHHYPQPGHYSLPGYYTPYPGYPLPATPAPATFQAAPSGSEVQPGPVAGIPPWQSMIYNSYAPYFNPPVRAFVTQQRHATGQAPLLPSGFIQNEQGTLIAVYPPDALDQYMASHNVNSSGISSTTSTQSVNTTQTWSQPQVLHGLASNTSIASQATINNPPVLQSSLANHSWNVFPPPFPPTPVAPATVANPPMLTYPSTTTVPGSIDSHEPAASSAPPAAIVRKQVPRKDHHNHHNFNRFSRTFHNRNGRTHLYNQGFNGNMEGGPNVNYKNAQTINNTGNEWGRWNARR